MSNPPDDIHRIIYALDKIAAALEELTKIFIRLEELIKPPEDNWNIK